MRNSLDDNVRTVSQFNFITLFFIQRVFRFEKVVQYVERITQMNSDFLFVFLSFIILEVDDDFAKLDECTILSFMNEELRTLSLRTKNVQVTNDHTFFFASVKYRRLFSFAPSYFLKNKANEKFVKKILNFERFNIKRFKKSYVHMMLKCKKTWEVDTTLKRWLFNF